MTTMKMTDKFLSAAVLTAAALCTSCSTDELTAQQQGQGETKAVALTATLGEMQTRAGMDKGTYDNTATFYWHNKDSILVQTVKASDNTYPGARFVTTEETGATVAVFWGEPLSGVTLGNYAVYPYNKKHAFASETALTYNLPASYTYTTVDTGIFSKETTDAEASASVTTYRTNSTNIPMYGKITDDNVSFDYLGGLAVIRIDQMPATSGTLIVTADQKLSGNFSVDLSADSPEMTTTTTDTDSEKQVKFTFSGATDGGVGVFYLPLATGSYTGVKIVLDCGEVNQTVDYGNLTITRACATAVPVVANIVINGHVFVDLGLPSGLLWAETNVGATLPTDYGDYYAWGETETKETYTSENYEYQVSASEIDAEHDVATVHWKSPCRMPTGDEFTGELFENTTRKGVNITTSSGTMVFGYQFTSLNNRNSVFLPASGNKHDGITDYQGLIGYYWRSTKSANDSNANCTFFDSKGNSGQGPLSIYYGLIIRPVAERPTASE